MIFDINSHLNLCTENRLPNVSQFMFSLPPSITDGVLRNENFVEIIPVFSTFSNFFKKKKIIIIKAILCNFSMRLLKYF